MGSLVTPLRTNRSWTAIVIEDEPLIAIDCETLLRQMGADDVAWVTTIEDAETAIAKRPPTVAIVDLYIGHGKTNSLIEYMHSIGIKILIYSGAAREEFTIGDDYAYTFLSKPCLEKRFSSAITDLLAANDTSSVKTAWRKNMMR